MTKTLNQIIFFSSTKIRIFFQQHCESDYFFRKKNITPPLPFQVKWSFPKQEYITVYIYFDTNVPLLFRKLLIVWF